MNSIICFIIGCIVGFVIGIGKHLYIEISFGGNEDE